MYRYFITLFYIGSKLTDINSWATQEFTPTPLKYKFSPIVNLFQADYVEKKNITNELGKPVDSFEIRKWFIPLYNDYCSVVDLDCSMPTGCGFDDKCPMETICEGGSTATHECGCKYNFS